MKKQELMDIISNNARAMTEFKNCLANIEIRLSEVEKQKYEPFNLEQIILKNLKENLSISIQKSCIEVMQGYGSPLKGIIEIIIKNNSEQFKQIFAETINEILQDNLSITDIKSELKKKLVRNLVNEATSNSDKLFEIFKNNPDLKAKLTLIITNFIEENKFIK
ncbi:MAG: hypothetical protein EBT63_05025 [Proteobacteria bacterium]|jgi:hypothetical protein|nr:hypothetical protein [Pseudomonadota bacterium]NCA28514.1 hypothetical protein [Pseudomonadota bacterium]